jgi:malate synthase
MASSAVADGGLLLPLAGQMASAAGFAATTARKPPHVRSVPLALLDVIAGQIIQAVAGHGAQQVAWGDIPTWLAVVAAAGAATAAFWQLGLQSKQLREQQQVIKAQTLLLERQQANRIDLTIQNDPQGNPGKRLIRADISNRSDRPIRGVRCRVEPVRGEQRAVAMTWMGELYP